MDDEALPPVRYTATVLQFEICLPPTSLQIHTRPCLTVDYSAVSSSKYKKKTACRSSFWCPVPKASALPTTGLISRTVEGTKKKTACRSSFWCPVPKASALPTTGLISRTVEGTKKKTACRSSFWCPEQDLNLHIFRYTHLKRARLPIPPSGLSSFQAFLFVPRTRLELAPPMATTPSK